MLIHTGPIAGIAAHGEWIATAGYDNKLILWNAADKTALAQGVHDHLINSCSFSNDGKWLVSASSDYSARVWSLPSMRLEAVLSGHEDDVDMAVFSPDSRFIATCALDRLVRVFDRKGQCLIEFKGHTGNVLALAWTHDGQHVISTSVDGTIRQWSIETRAMSKCNDLQVRTDSIEISSSGLIYAGDDLGRIARIDESNISYVFAHQAGIKKVVLDDKLNQLVCLSYDGFLSVWDITNSTPIEISRSKLPENIWARSAAILKDGRVVAGTFGSTYAIYDCQTSLWDMSGVKAGSAINAVASNDGKTYSVGDAGDVFENNSLIASMGSLCNFLVCSQDLLLSGGQLGKLFNARTAEVLYEHHSPLNCAVCFEHHNQNYVAVGAYTGEIIIFLSDKNSVRFMHLIKVYENAVKGVSVAKGQLFSVCANTDIAWHSIENFELQNYINKAHQKITNDCCAIDDDRFATISRDRDLKIWNGKSHEIFPSPHPNSVKCICINDDRSKLLTGSYGGTLAMFDVLKKKWMKYDRPTTAGISDIAWDDKHQQFLASSYDGNIYSLVA